GEFRELRKYPQSRTYCWCWSPDGAQCLIRSESIRDGKTVPQLELWDLRRREALNPIPFPGDVRPLAFAPDGRTCVVQVGGELLTYDVRSREVVDRQRFPEVASLSYSPDGKKLALGMNDNRIEIRDAKTSKVERTIQPGERASCTALAWSPDGT